MIVDLTKLSEKPKEFDLKIESDQIDLESDFVHLREPAAFIGKIKNTGRRTEIEGKIRAEVDLSCNRCLVAVPKKLAMDFENAFVSPKNYTEEEEIEIEVKDLDVSIFEGDQIDLIEVTREQILLALPTQVLCKDSCKGLCEDCGANRNLKSCKCEEEKVDPRWAGLSKLKVDKEK